ncbi:MAG: hypothetical protein L0Y60_02730 [Beijerinckiaceae bacterium]|nr:hypothetical protein [Beijerinckiaceae bacterium]
MGARRRLRYVEPRGGGAKAAAGDDFAENPRLGAGQGETRRKAPDLGAKAG